MSVGVTRSVNVVRTAEERERAVAARLAGRQRIDRLTVGPDGQGRARNLTAAEAEAGALYGTPDEIAAKLQALRDVGAEYVLLNSQGGLPSLRRFARELIPVFAAEPSVAVTA
jgi:alkanesulfonate monooxygenase SsuD/methylene tetrahydromethanopterin reductase-like flavin-dependent oxidoreductase (luciferase family)